MSNKLELVKKTRYSLESLYLLYDGNKGGGDLIVVDELNGILYKGKDFHFDQELIYFENDDGIIKIDGYAEDERPLYTSGIILSKSNEEVSFYNLEKDSEEYLFLSEFNTNVNNMINLEHSKRYNKKWQIYVNWLFNNINKLCYFSM